MRQYHFIIGLLTLALIAGCAESKPPLSLPSVIIDRPTPEQGASSSMQALANAEMPPSLLITVPFAPQAPYANWDALHEEACEEMSLIMVHHFLEGTQLSREDAETELQEMVAWERKHDYGDDITTTELGEIAQALYGYRVRVLTDVTANMLKEELQSGNPVIVPMAGRLLGNPFFSGEGPWYHMLVVTGYNERGFITNDPGTKRGEKYWYKTDVLMNAIHDWTGVKEEIENGAKNALVVEK